MLQSPSARGTRKTTLSDVAATAKVSLPTVSKVLHGHPDVAHETRARVEAALLELDYVGRTVHERSIPRSIEVMVDKLSTPYAMEVIRGTTLEAEALGVDIVLSRFHRAAPENGWQKPGDWAKRLAASKRTGAIILTAHLGHDPMVGLGGQSLPVVVIDPLELTNFDVPSVGSTNWAGGKAATDHLLGLGHTRIGAIGGPELSMAATARMHGFRSACVAAGVTVDESLVVFTGFDYESGLAVADDWFARPDPPTAVFAASDTQAMGVLEAARRHHLDVPGDVSVLGYDDTYIASWATPQLTSIRQPLEQMGRVALRSLMRVADGDHLDAVHVELTTELVVRDSTAPPRTRLHGTTPKGTR